MRFITLVLVIFMFAFTSSAFGQITVFMDTFEDSSLDTMWNENVVTLWKTSSTTYAINEENGFLNIDYNRTTESGDGDFISFNPPQEMDVSDNLKIQFRLKSSINTILNFRISSATIRPQIQEFEREISGEDEWHDYTFSLDEEIFSNSNLQRVQFIFDRGSDSNHSGSIQIDDFKVGDYLINTTGVTAMVTNGNDVDLTWSAFEPESISEYSIYRGTTEEFSPSEDSFITTTSGFSHLEENLDPYSVYFYKIVATDTLGEEYQPTPSVRAETYEVGVLPEITITNINSEEVGKYELFALELDLENVGINNPYDPDDIDLHAWFKSSAGDTTHINGFYDDYQNADQWRVYFSPDETGSWEYQVHLSDVGGTGSTTKRSFDVVDSEHTGPLKVAENNPNYLTDHDDRFYYGFSVYYPWDVQENGLDRLEEFGLNMIGYWNGTYDNAGNGGGRYLIESMQSGLGRYDQRKLGRIEQILGWLEERDMKMMFAMWAHPFLRDGPPGWDPIHWAPNNPYQEIVSARNFFTDDLAWEYQKKQYRYLIARLGHHRALGIWEIINEMHGTTGYYYDEKGGRTWVNKVHDYLKEHDPYQRPTTASFGSVNIWTQFDIKADIVNRHYYETGGEYSRPFNDNVRDGLFNITDVYKNLKNADGRPAMLGEAGYTSMFSDVDSFDYTEEFHNAFWSGIATGMASTPFWWDYTTLSIFPDERMEVYGRFSNFVSKLDLANNNYEIEERDESGANVYIMRNDEEAFGWLRSYADEVVSDKTVPLHGLSDGSYKVEWFDTWTGETAASQNIVSIAGISELTTPEYEVGHPDIAFRVENTANGSEATSLNMMLISEVVSPTADPFTVFTIAVYITDEEGRLADNATHEINFSLDGSGSLSETSAVAEDGVALIEYTPGESGGSFSITAEASELESATFEKIVTNSEEENAEGQPQDFSLQQNYPNPFNPSTVISYQLAQPGNVQLEVFDITGRKVAVLINKQQPAGTHQVTFEAGNLSSGVYLYRIKAGLFTDTRRMVLVK